MESLLAIFPKPITYLESVIDKKPGVESGVCMEGGARKAQGGRQTGEEEGAGFFRDTQEPFGHHLS